jgi:hypothetical protein
MTTFIDIAQLFVNGVVSPTKPKLVSTVKQRKVGGPPAKAKRLKWNAKFIAKSANYSMDKFARAIVRGLVANRGTFQFGKVETCPRLRLDHLDVPMRVLEYFELVHVDHTNGHCMLDETSEPGLNEAAGIANILASLSHQEIIHDHAYDSSLPFPELLDFNQEPVFQSSHYRETDDEGKALPYVEGKHQSDECTPVSKVDREPTQTELMLRKIFSNVHQAAQDIGELTGGLFDDSCVKTIEMFLFLILSINSSSDYFGAIAAVLQYLSHYVDSSITKTVYDFLTEEFISTVFGEAQSGFTDEDTPADKAEKVVVTNYYQKVASEWREFLEQLKHDWDNVVHNPLFTHFSRLLGVACVFGLADQERLTFTLRDLKVWEPDLQVVHGKAFDVIDAGFKGILFFAEKISLVMEKRSWASVICDDTEAIELDELYSRILEESSLVRNGNLERITGKKGEKRTEAQYCRDLNRCSVKMKEAIKLAKGYSKRMFEEKLIKLSNLELEYTTMQVDAGMREAPYAYCLYGPSSQGKSSIYQNVTKALAYSQDLEIENDLCGVLNLEAKHQEQWRSSYVACLIDDMASSKKEFWPNAPSDWIIRLVNNQPYIMEMASLEKKGKVTFNSLLLGITTNSKTLGCEHSSACPFAVLRRFKTITCRAREQFQKLDDDGNVCGLDQTKVNLYYQSIGRKPDVEDLWTFSVEEPKQPPEHQMHLLPDYQIVTYKGHRLANVSYRVLQQYLIDDFARHRKSQAEVLARNSPKSRPPKCPIAGCYQMAGMCDAHDETTGHSELWLPQYTDYDTSKAKSYSEFEKDQYTVKAKEASFQVVGEPVERLLLDVEKQMSVHLGIRTYTTLTMIGNLFKKQFLEPVTGMDLLAEKVGCKLLYMQAERMFNSVRIMQFVPTPWMSHPWMKKFIKGLAAERAYKWAFKTFWFTTAACTSFTLGTRYKYGPFRDNLVLIGSFWTAGLGVWATSAKATYKVMERQLRKEQVIAPALAAVRDRHTTTFLKVGGVMFTLTLGYKAYRLYAAQEFKPQGTLTPISVQEIQERDKEKNVWAKVDKSPLPIGDLAKTGTPAQVKRLVARATMKVKLYPPDNPLNEIKMNGLFMTTSVLLLPGHVFEKYDELVGDLIDGDTDYTGHRFAVRLCKEHSVAIPNADLTLVYAPVGNAWKDLSKFLLPSHPSKSAVDYTLVYRGDDYEMNFPIGSADYGRANIPELNIVYNSWLCNSSIHTFNGLCGASMVSNNQALILGMHTAGKDGTALGICSIMTQRDYEDALKVLSKKASILLSGSSGVFEKQCLNVPTVVEKPNPHEKSWVNYCPPKGQWRWHNASGTRAHDKTCFRVSLISEYVIDRMGFPNNFRGPKMSPQWHAFQVCAANMALPGHPFPGELLDEAVKDYLSHILPICKRKMYAGTKPLTEHETTNGIKGVKFINPMNWKSTIGPPLTGKKSEYALLLGTDRLEDDYLPEEAFDREIIPEMIERIRDKIAILKTGRRMECLTKACKKDEILTKEKCRIFYSNSFELVFVLRMYFLPLTRIIQLNPLDFECAVGINCHSNEWEQFHGYATKFGTNRIVGGDYSKYDQKLPSQLILAAFRILIDMAYVLGYSEEDLCIMKAVVSDVVFAYIQFDGELVSLTEGGHISGNSLTVIINSLVGSLNARCCFYANRPPGRFEKFRDCVAFMTYGDDNIGSVSSTCDWFDTKQFGEFLSQYGQEYTMPDKSVELTNFLPLSQFEFLKRKSVYIPEIGCTIGALNETSISKSLHAYLRGKNPPMSEEGACAVNIDTALLEYFNHGREVYEERRKQLRLVAEDAGISVLCRRLDQTFDERVRDWKENYAK